MIRPPSCAPTPRTAMPTPASTSRSPPTPERTRISLSASRSQACRSVMIEIEVGQCRSRMSASAAPAGGVQDEISNLLRVCDQRQVTGVHLYRLRMHTVCKEPLQLRRRGSILLRYGIRRRLEFPRCCRRARGEKRVGDPPLHRVEHTRLGWIDAAGEVLEEGLLAQLGEAARLEPPTSEVATPAISMVEKVRRSIMLIPPILNLVD